jgi:hypothetical protein
MAKLSARGASIVAQVQKDDEITKTSIAFRSDGKILVKVGSGGWKIFRGRPTWYGSLDEILVELRLAGWEQVK